MAVYLLILTAVLAGAGLLVGSVTLAIALATAGAVVFVALRYGRLIVRGGSAGGAAGDRAASRHCLRKPGRQCP